MVTVMTDEQIIPVINGMATLSTESVSIMTTRDYVFDLSFSMLLVVEDLPSITTTSLIIALFSFLFPSSIFYWYSAEWFLAS